MSREPSKILSAVERKLQTLDKKIGAQEKVVAKAEKAFLKETAKLTTLKEKANA